MNSLIKIYNNLGKFQDRRILASVIALVLGGYMMVVSAYGFVYLRYGFNWFMFSIGRIAVFIIAGFIAMVYLTKKFSGRRQANLIHVITGIIFVMMPMTLLFEPVNGAQSWLRLGPISVQPVEFLKVVSILQFAWFFSRDKVKEMPLWKMLGIPFLYLSVCGVLIFGLQNDLGNFLIMLMIAFTLFMVIPDRRIRGCKILFGGLLLVGVVLLYFNGRAISDWIFALPEGTTGRIQMLRIAVLFNPLYDVFRFGFQLTNSLVAISSAGIMGSGLNTSLSKTILPEAHNDAIIAVIAEEFGMVGVSVLFILNIIIIMRLLNYAMKCKDNYDRYILIGISTFFMAQFFVNIGGMVGLIPMTGVTLMFVSSGGSSIIMAFISIGIAQGIIRRYRNDRNRPKIVRNK